MEDFCNAVRGLAAEYGCGLVDMNKLAKNEDMAKFTMMNDGIYCSEYGHSKYLENISAHLISKYPYAGDMNGDKKVDTTDLSALKNALGAAADENSPADLNRNGKIDVNDYLYIKRGDFKWTK